MKHHTLLAGLMISIATITTGCAHKTVHEQCSEPDVISRYRDYDQCYADRQAAEARRNYALQHIGDGFKPRNEPTASNTPRNCTMTQTPGYPAQIYCR